MTCSIFDVEMKYIRRDESEINVLKTKSEEAIKNKEHVCLEKKIDERKL